MFRNNGDGSFREVSAKSGIAAHAGAGMGTIALDYDNDGRTDIFVCNDKYWNFLFHNDGAGKFREAALAAGVSCNYAGDPVSGMGVDAADYLHNGRLDLFMTDYSRQNAILYKNLGSGDFEDVTMQAGAAAGSFPYIKWGCGFVDFDNDGHRDLFIGCGHLGEYASKIDLLALRRPTRSPDPAAQPGARQVRQRLRPSGDGPCCEAGRPRGRLRRPGQRRPRGRGDSQLATTRRPSCETNR